MIRRLKFGAKTFKPSLQTRPSDRDTSTRSRPLRARRRRRDDDGRACGERRRHRDVILTLRRTCDVVRREHDTHDDDVDRRASEWLPQREGKAPTSAIGDVVGDDDVAKSSHFDACGVVEGG